MKIFPEGTEKWIQPTGITMFVLGCIWLIVALIAFPWRSSQWKHWPRTQGKVVQARVTRGTNEEGTVLCGVELTVQYSANNGQRQLQHESTSKSSNCSWWEDEAKRAIGQTREVVYDPGNSHNSHLTDDRLSFFVMPFVSAVIGVVFVFGGYLSWLMGRGIIRRGIKLP